MSFDKVGYTIYPIEKVLKSVNGTSRVAQFLAQQANPARHAIYTAFVDSFGDGNCGPRSIIQSLLLKGVLQNQQEFVYQFLYHLYSNHKDKLQPYEKYAPHNIVPTDPRPPLGQGTVRLPHASKGQLETDLITFLDRYRHLPQTPESLAYIQSHMPVYGPGRVRPVRDPILYLLAAYLRFDIISHINQTPANRPEEPGIAQNRFDRLQLCLAVADDNMLDDLATLEKNTNLQVTGWYFADKQIHIQVYSESGDAMVSCLYDNRDDFGTTLPFMDTTIYRIPGGSHYATLINPEVDRLQPLHSQRETPVLTNHAQFALSFFNTFRSRFLFCLLCSACSIGMAIAIGGSALPFGIGIAALTVLGLFATETCRNNLVDGHDTRVMRSRWVKG